MGHWEDVGKSDDWYTPKYIFDALNCRFDMDVAAPKEGPRHVPTGRWIHTDSLMARWNGFIWMNPPFGPRNGIVPWLDKFFDHGNGIALVPDRTSAPWFQDAGKKADGILFMSPKVKFERPDGSLGKSPSTGTALLAAGIKAYAIMTNAADELGFMVQRLGEKHDRA